MLYIFFCQSHLVLSTNLCLQFFLRINESTFVLRYACFKSLKEFYTAHISFKKLVFFKKDLFFVLFRIVQIKGSISFITKTHSPPFKTVNNYLTKPDMICFVLNHLANYRPERKKRGK